MEGRVSRGRGGSWKRGGRGGNDSQGPAGEHRGRGRGGHHRGRGRRDHHRGRGRGSSAADFHQRDRDDGDASEEEDDTTKMFSRRKLESNWDRYEASEKPEPDDDTPTQRGTDFNVLLESAGDFFTQFRFSEEKEWEMDAFTASLMSVVPLDVSALADLLEEVPLHQRLNLEPELQVTAPVELPPMALQSRAEAPKTSPFSPPTAALKKLSVEQRAAPHPAVEEEDDEELEELLAFQKPRVEPVSVKDEERDAPHKPCEEMTEEVKEEKTEEVKEKIATPSKTVKPELTEEDLEDWLDTMIS